MNDTHQLTPDTPSRKHETQNLNPPGRVLIQDLKERSRPHDPDRSIET